jgi:hypothetical protein
MERRGGGANGERGGAAELSKAPKLALVAVVLAVGCEAPSRPPTVRVETTSPAFALGAPVTFTVTNLGGGPVYLAACCDVVTLVDRWEDGLWRGPSDGVACLGICPMYPRELSPRATYSGSVSVADTGRYRLRFGIAGTWSGAPDWSRTSAPFEVR